MNRTAPAARPRPDSHASPSPRPASADVLVVEDRPSLRTMLRRTLEAKGYSCDIAPPELVGREVINPSKLADPNAVVRLVDHDETATIWADLTENAAVLAATGGDTAVAPESEIAPVDQSAIDALFSSAA